MGHVKLCNGSKIILFIFESSSQQLYDYDFSFVDFNFWKYIIISVLVYRRFLYGDFINILISGHVSI